MARRELTPEQRERARLASAEWRAADPERRKETDRKSYAKNREKKHEAMRAYREKHREEARARTRAWNAADPERRRESDRNSHGKHREKNNKQHREYYAKNRDKVLEQRARYQAANAERRRDYSREYYKKNRAKFLEKASQHYAEHAEARREYSREYSKNNREACRKRKAAWVKANPEREQARQRKQSPAKRISSAAWNKAHPERVRVNSIAKRARRRGASGTHTPCDIARILEMQRGSCAACNVALLKVGKGKYHIDHVMPLIRGGSNGPENLQLLCPSCNLSKGRKHPDEWARALALRLQLQPRPIEQRGLKR